MRQTYRSSPLEATDGPELASLFKASGAPCYCRWWDFHGDKNEWLDRCYNRPDENREDLLRAVSAGDLEGVVARSDADALVGWMRLSPASGIAKLYDQRLYRGLPCFVGEREAVMTIGCFLVHPEERRRGVARSLLHGGVETARKRGARALEAFPRRDNLVGPEALWTGPYDLLSELGFEVVNDFAPYPVMRKRL